MSEAITTGGQLEYAMPVETVMAQIRAIQNLMRHAMKPGEHYGIIPGTSRKDKDGREMAKPSLLKPGAEKICMMFRLAPSYQVEAITYPGGHLEYRIICTLTNIRTGDIWGQGVKNLFAGVKRMFLFRWKQREKNAQLKTCPPLLPFISNPTSLDHVMEFGS